MTHHEPPGAMTPDEMTETLRMMLSSLDPRDLIRIRGITGAVMLAFGFCLAPETWSVFYGYLAAHGMGIGPDAAQAGIGDALSWATEMMHVLRTDP